MNSRRTLALVLLLGWVSAMSGDSGPRAESKRRKPERHQELPPGELGRVVALGREIVINTGKHPLSSAFVGNALTCQSCHLHAGTDPRAASFLGIATAYPAWSPREERVITLEDRVLNCFMRSLNGVRPPNGSKVSVAVTTYITWLSQGQALAMNPRAPLGPLHIRPLSIPDDQADPVRGESLYAENCASCHGSHGKGAKDIPPVWGKHSYNDGAGLSRNDQLGAWLKVAMPPDDPYLSDQESLDLASFLNSHPRPKFILKDHLPAPEHLGEYNSEP